MEQEEYTLDIPFISAQDQGSSSSSHANDKLVINSIITAGNSPVPLLDKLRTINAILFNSQNNFLARLNLVGATQLLDSPPNTYQEEAVLFALGSLSLEELENYAATIRLNIRAELNAKIDDTIIADYFLMHALILSLITDCVVKPQATKNKNLLTDTDKLDEEKIDRLKLLLDRVQDLKEQHLDIFHYFLTSLSDHCIFLNRKKVARFTGSFLAIVLSVFQQETKEDFFSSLINKFAFTEKNKKVLSFFLTTLDKENSQILQDTLIKRHIYLLKDNNAKPELILEASDKVKGKVKDSIDDMISTPLRYDINSLIASYHNIASQFSDKYRSGYYLLQAFPSLNHPNTLNCLNALENLNPLLGPLYANFFKLRLVLALELPPEETFQEIANIFNSLATHVLIENDFENKLFDRFFQSINKFLFKLFKIESTSSSLKEPLNFFVDQLTQSQQICFFDHYIVEAFDGTERHKISGYSENFNQFIPNLLFLLNATHQTLLIERLILQRTAIQRHICIEYEKSDFPAYSMHYLFEIINALGLALNQEAPAKVEALVPLFLDKVEDDKEQLIIALAKALIWHYLQNDSITLRYVQPFFPSIAKKTGNHVAIEKLIKFEQNFAGMRSSRAHTELIPLIVFLINTNSKQLQEILIDGKTYLEFFAQKKYGISEIRNELLPRMTIQELGSNSPLALAVKFEQLTLLADFQQAKKQRLLKKPWQLLVKELKIMGFTAAISLVAYVFLKLFTLPDPPQGPILTLPDWISSTVGWITTLSFAFLGLGPLLYFLIYACLQIEGWVKQCIIAFNPDLSQVIGNEQIHPASQLAYANNPEFREFYCGIEDADPGRVGISIQYVSNQAHQGSSDANPHEGSPLLGLNKQTSWQSGALGGDRNAFKEEHHNQDKSTCTLQ